MAIQKHLVSYAQQKANPDQGTITMNELMQILDCLETNYALDSSSAVPLLSILIKSLAQIQMPRDAPELKVIRPDIARIASLFNNLPISNDERLKIFECVYCQLISPTYEPQPLIALGFLVIPHDMISQAIDHIFKLLQWNGNKIRESIKIAMRRLIMWRRSCIFDVPLDLWIARTLNLLNTNGHNDIIDEIASENIVPAFIALCIPIFQTKIFCVVQVLLESARNTKELFDKILPRCTLLLKTLENTKSEIYENLMELICETLATINQTDFRYKELVRRMKTF